MVSWEKLAIAKILSGIPKSTTLHVIPKIKSKRASFSPCSLFRHYPMKYWGKHTFGPDTPSHVNQKITCGLTLRVRTKLTANHRAPQSTWSDGFDKFKLNTHTGMFAAKVLSSNKFAVTKCFSKRRPTQKPCCPSCGWLSKHGSSLCNIMCAENLQNNRAQASGRKYQCRFSVFRQHSEQNPSPAHKKYGHVKANHSIRFTIMVAKLVGMCLNTPAQTDIRPLICSLLIFELLPWVPAMS